jgi:putative flippase GtrA
MSTSLPTRVRVRAAVLARSAGVGAIATLTDLGVLALLATGLGLGPRVASVPALLAGIAVQFVGNKLFAFRDRSPRWIEQAAAFGAIEVLGACLNVALFDWAVRALPLPYLATRLLVTNAVYLGVCLPLWSRVFAAPAPRAELP